MWEVICGRKPADRSDPSDALIPRPSILLPYASMRSAPIRMLLDKGLKVNETDNAGATPLHVAVLKDNPPVVEVLLKRGAKVNAKLPANAAIMNFGGRGGGWLRDSPYP